MTAYVVGWTKPREVFPHYETCEPCQRGRHELCPIFTCHCLHQPEGDA